ncbi:MAG: hypothetical protein JWQ21_2678 [Herminiimonas sp.]|jgi:hypothetical protein|nr:hypothetical protein [Herminiimonas sp.]
MTWHSSRHSAARQTGHPFARCKQNSDIVIDFAGRAMLQSISNVRDNRPIPAVGGSDGFEIALSKAIVAACALGKFSLERLVRVEEAIRVTLQMS